MRKWCKPRIRWHRTKQRWHLHFKDARKCSAEEYACAQVFVNTLNVLIYHRSTP